jgi:uncharacterized membrane protein YsdA (DUF1294 family)/cold shock CspA family protein
MMALQQGRLIKWDDAKGYGFIAPADGGDAVFAHISAFVASRARPAVGDKVRYSVRQEKGKGLRAEGVHLPLLLQDRIEGAVLVAMITATLFFSAVLWLSREYVFSYFLVVALVALSVITLLLYGWDKRSAVKDKQRVREDTLHLLALAGGWPGALIARPLFRHKTRKQPFATLFGATVVCSVACLLFFLLSEQAVTLRNWLDIEAMQWRTLMQPVIAI